MTYIGWCRSPYGVAVTYIGGTPWVWLIRKLFAAMKEGTLRWNKVFELIGFKDAEDVSVDKEAFGEDGVLYWRVWFLLIKGSAYFCVSIL